MTEEEILETIFRKRGLQSARDQRAGTDLPTVPSPGIFQPDPLVVGGSGLAEMSRNFMNRFPLVKQEIKQINEGPMGSSMMNRADARFSGAAPYDYMPEVDGWTGTSNVGFTDRGDPRQLRQQQIGIQPGMNPTMQGETLVHEAGHTLGADEEFLQKNLEPLFRALGLNGLFPGANRIPENGR